MTHPRRNNPAPLVSHLHHLLVRFPRSASSLSRQNQEKKKEVEEAYIKLREKEMKMEKARIRQGEELKMQKIKLQRWQIELMEKTKRDQDIIF